MGTMSKEAICSRKQKNKAAFPGIRMLNSGKSVIICKILTIENSWFKAADRSRLTTRLLDMTIVLVYCMISVA